MSDNLDSCSKLERIKGSVSYKCLDQSNGRYTVTVAVSKLNQLNVILYAHNVSTRLVRSEKREGCILIRLRNDWKLFFHAITILIKVRLESGHLEMTEI